MASNNISISYRPETKTIMDLVNLCEDDALNLEPGFQRQSVWNERDRARLIDSIWRNYPLPAIFLYRREENGHIFYDVIDGKQRLESILMFMGEMRGKFRVKLDLPNIDGRQWVSWRKLAKLKLQHRVTGYRLPVIEVDGELSDIIDVFVRINSTGKALTNQEKRHARYYNSPFLKEAARLASRFESYFHKMGVLSASQISRMKHVELIAELMISIHRGDAINKKTALDKAMNAQDFGRIEIKRTARATITTLKRVKKLFPKLSTTRFCQMTDFYSLALLFSKFESEGYILTDKKRNRLAWDLLVSFGTRVDDIRERQRKMLGQRAGDDLYREYLMTVSQMTDDLSQRRKREDILRGILGTLFAKKDSQRGFSSEQRRIIWSASSERKCSRCRKSLLWTDFTVDHIRPHSKGGRSQLDNAALMCRSCNSAKGNRRNRNK